MALERMKIAGVISAAAMFVVFAGVASAQDAGERAQPRPEAALKAQMREQNILLDENMEDLSAVGANLEDAQARMDGARLRARELRAQTRDLNRDLAVHQEILKASKGHYEERARAAYKGNDLEGLAALLRSFLGGDGVSRSPTDFGVAEILLDDRENYEAYRDNRRIIRNTIRQLSQKEGAYGQALSEERAQAAELRRQEVKLDTTIARIRSDRREAEERLEELKARERERIRRTRPATGGSNPKREDSSGGAAARNGDDAKRGGEGEPQEKAEIRVARAELPQAELQLAWEEEIFAQPMESLSRAKYLKLYKKAARDYGFARDWYILAAVGKVESNHGEIMGPSSAGAMGPMQFLPSTWEGSGVDGNGDGKANIMDPRDAIPAAAGYLRVGGAPDDWYAALYSYNHADWYVLEVLAVAEAYRQQAKDDRVGPYV